MLNVPSGTVNRHATEPASEQRAALLAEHATASPGAKPSWALGAFLTRKTGESRCAKAAEGDAHAQAEQRFCRFVLSCPFIPLLAMIGLKTLRRSGK
jgi:hypothetical protein